jgi:hypothetical protein
MDKYTKIVLTTIALCALTSPAKADKRTFEEAVSKLPVVVGTQWGQDISFWVVVRSDANESSTQALAQLICRIASKHGVWNFSATVWKLNPQREVGKSRCY